MRKNFPRYVHERRYVKRTARIYIYMNTGDYIFSVFLRYRRVMTMAVHVVCLVKKKKTARHEKKKKSKTHACNYHLTFGTIYIYLIRFIPNHYVFCI